MGWQLKNNVLFCRFFPSICFFTTSTKYKSHNRTWPVRGKAGNGLDLAGKQGTPVERGTHTQKTLVMLPRGEFIFKSLSERAKQSSRNEIILPVTGKRCPSSKRTQAVWHQVWLSLFRWRDARITWAARAIRVVFIDGDAWYLTR